MTQRLGVRATWPVKLAAMHTLLWEARTWSPGVWEILVWLIWRTVLAYVSTSLAESATTHEGLSVLVPCLNEAENLTELVRRVRAAFANPDMGPGPARELILIDDGSSDDTWPTMRRLSATWSELRVVRHPTRLGIPAAWRSGLRHGRGAWVCVLDADLQYDPEEIARLWAAQKATDADVVQGTRATRERRHDLRYLLSRSLNTLLNRTFDMSLQDNKSGFFLCQREVLQMLLGFRRHFRHWQCFVMVAAHHHGLNIHQVKTPFRPRSAGRSAFGRIPIGSTVGVALDLLTALSEYRRRRA